MARSGPGKFVPERRQCKPRMGAVLGRSRLGRAGLGARRREAAPANFRAVFASILARDNAEALWFLPGGRTGAVGAILEVPCFRLFPGNSGQTVARSCLTVALAAGEGTRMRSSRP